MKRKAVQSLLIVLLACFTAAAVAMGDNPKPRPFKGIITAEAFFDFGSDACLEVTGAFWKTYGYGVGDLTHLGESELYVSHCSTLDGLHLVNGEGALVAANGDEIWFTYTAELISHDEIPPLPVVLVMLQENIVTGGTGRFEGASGTFMALVAVTVEDMTSPTAPVDVQLFGSITY